MLEGSQINGWMNAFFGGALIGLAAALLMLFHGKVLGVSGFMRNLLDVTGHGRLNSFALLGGMAIAAILFSPWLPSAFENTAPRSNSYLLLAGLLVGYGTSLGNGCTSGHGVCGLSRWSYRSLIATVSFMGSGFVVASLLKQFGGL